MSIFPVKTNKANQLGPQKARAGTRDKAARLCLRRYAKDAMKFFLFFIFAILQPSVLFGADFQSTIEKKIYHYFPNESVYDLGSPKQGGVAVYSETTEKGYVALECSDVNSYSIRTMADGAKGGILQVGLCDRVKAIPLIEEAQDVIENKGGPLRNVVEDLGASEELFEAIGEFRENALENDFQSNHFTLLFFSHGVIKIPTSIVHAEGISKIFVLQFNIRDDSICKYKPDYIFCSNLDLKAEKLGADILSHFHEGEHN